MFQSLSFMLYLIEIIIKTNLDKYIFDVFQILLIKINLEKKIWKTTTFL
jgi:hypothetical protein